MPNSFAYVMLFAWPLVALILFRVLPLSKAVIWTILGGYLILPSATSVELPMLPALDKQSVPTLSALFFGLIFARRTGAANTAPQTRRPGGRGWAVAVVLLAMLAVGPFLTLMQNFEPIITGTHFTRGLVFYDGLSMFSNTLFFILPFFLGLRYLGTREAHVQLMQAFVIGAVIYSLPVLFELRMSPQLHYWFYGLFPHSFVQHIRADGFRPLVFLSHGLLVGMLYCTALLCALALWREALREGKTSSGWIFAIVWLVIILVLSKNLGALVIAILLGALVTFTGRRLQITAAVVIAAIVLLFPMLRGAGLVPVDTVHSIALSIDEERAASLRFRFDNEDALLEHANEKPMFGWGSWGRNQLYDPDTGRAITVTDGFWVIMIGLYGWWGYFAHFGLLILPILLYARHRREMGPSLITPGLVIVLSASLIDLLPNAGLVPYVWLMTGALTGFVLKGVGEASVAPDPTPVNTRHRWNSPTGAVAPASWVMQGLEPQPPQGGNPRGSRQRRQGFDRPR